MMKSTSLILGCIILYSSVASSSSSTEIPTSKPRNQFTLSEVVEHAELINSMVARNLYFFSKDLDEFKRNFSLVTNVPSKITALELDDQKIKSRVQELEKQVETTVTESALADLQLQFQSKLDAMDMKFETLLLKHKEMEGKCEALELDNMDLKMLLRNTTERVMTLESYQERVKLELDEEWVKLESDLQMKGMELQENKGRLVSFNVTNRAKDDQELGCGGILVGDNGQISYRTKTTASFKATEIRCIWTVRANRKSSVTFQLQADQLGSSVLKLTPLKTTLSVQASQEATALTSATMTLRSSDRNTFHLEGPVVFVTLIGDSSQPLSFTLKYQGTGGDQDFVRTYSHYHFRERNGSVDFPKMRGVANYSNRELATFVLNPPRPSGGLKIETSFVDMEWVSNCHRDSLTHFGGEASRPFYYGRFGPPILQMTSNSSERTFPTDQRFCGRQGSLEGEIGGNTATESFISIFKSDHNVEGSGFRFNWSMPLE